MSPSSEAILKTALSLPPEDREALAEQLLRSLNDPTGAVLAPEWKAEIERRLRAVDDGTAELIDGGEAMAWLKSLAAGKVRP